MITRRIFQRQFDGKRFDLPWPFHLTALQSNAHFLTQSDEDDDEDDRVVPLMVCRFNKGKYCNILAVADERGFVRVFDTKPKKEVLKYDWEAHRNAVFDLAWVPGIMQMFTVSGDQAVILWQLENGSAEQMAIFNGHLQTIRGVDYFPNGDKSLLVTSSRDGRICVWDPKCTPKEDGRVQPLCTISDAHSSKRKNAKKNKKGKPLKKEEQGESRSVPCVHFLSDCMLASAGADGTVRVWQFKEGGDNAIVRAKATIVRTFTHTKDVDRRRGYTSMSIDSGRTRLFATCTDNHIYMYDILGRSNLPVCHFRGFRIQSYYIKGTLSPDNKYLASGSSDFKIYIWQVDNPKASPVVLEGHATEVNDVAWSEADSCKLVTVSDDTMRIWHVRDREGEQGLQVLSGNARMADVLPSPLKKATPRKHGFPHRQSMHQTEIRAWLQPRSSSMEMPASPSLTLSSGSSPSTPTSTETSPDKETPARQVCSENQGDVLINAAVSKLKDCTVSLDLATPPGEDWSNSSSPDVGCQQRSMNEEDAVMPSSSFWHDENTCDGTLMKKPTDVGVRQASAMSPQENGPDFSSRQTGVGSEGGKVLHCSIWNEDACDGTGHFVNRENVAPASSKPGKTPSPQMVGKRALPEEMETEVLVKRTRLVFDEGPLSGLSQMVAPVSGHENTRTLTAQPLTTRSPNKLSVKLSPEDFRRTQFSLTLLSTPTANLPCFSQDKTSRVDAVQEEQSSVPENENSNTAVIQSEKKQDRASRKPLRQCRRSRHSKRASSSSENSNSVSPAPGKKPVPGVKNILDFFPRVNPAEHQ